MILIDLFVNDEELQKELMGVISMTSSCIERRENELKKEAEKKAEAKIANKIIENIDENGKINPKTLQKILVIASKL